MTLNLLRAKLRCKRSQRAISMVVIEFFILLTAACRCRRGP